MSVLWLVCVCVYSFKTCEEDLTEEIEAPNLSARTSVFNNILVLNRDFLPGSRESKDPKIQRRESGHCCRGGASK